eukprot:403353882
MMRETAHINLWLERARDLLGEYNPSTLKFYGILGRTLIEQHRAQYPDYTLEQLQEIANFNTGYKYLQKYSKLSMNASIFYLKVLDESNVFTLKNNFHYQELYFEFEGIEDSALQDVIWTVFSRYLSLRDFKMTIKQIREDLLWDDQDTGVIKRICQNQELFEVFMRYFNGMIIEGETKYSFKYQPKYEYESIKCKLDINEKVKIFKAEAELKITFMCKNYVRTQFHN